MGDKQVQDPITTTQFIQTNTKIIQQKLVQDFDRFDIQGKKYLYIYETE